MAHDCSQSSKIKIFTENEFMCNIMYSSSIRYYCITIYCAMLLCILHYSFVFSLEFSSYVIHVLLVYVLP